MLLKVNYNFVIVLVILVGLTAGESLNAQISPQTIQLGSGTQTNTTTGTSPVNIWFRRSVMQFVYTAAELNAAGIQGECDLYEMGWFVTQIPVNDLPDYTIKLKHVTANNVAAPLGQTGWTTVVSPFLYAPTAGNWDMLTLDTPFQWNGIDNIGVEVCWSQVQPSFNSSGQNRIYNEPNGFRFSRTDAAGNSCTDNPASTNSDKPQVQMVWSCINAEDDAGVSQIVKPGVPNCLSKDVYVKLINEGENPLTNLRIAWSVNGVNQLPRQWTGFLPPQTTTPSEVFVGDFNFQNGDQIVVWTENPNGVQDVFTENDTSTFTIPNFTLSNMPEEELLCPGDQISLSSGVGFAGHQWSTGAGLPSITVNQGGIYNLTITDNASGCEHYYAVNVIEDQAVDLPDTLVWGCSIDGGVTLQGNKSRANYLWSNGQQGSRITVTQSGTYWVQVTDATQTCLSSDTVEVEIYELPNPSFTQNRDYLTLIFTNNTQDADSYLWDFGDGQTSTDFEPTHLYVQPGNYDVRLTAFNLCGQRSTNELIGVDPVGVSNFSLNNSVEVYPNPSNGVYNLQLLGGSEQEKKVSVTDMQGKILLSKNIVLSGNLQNEVIDLTEFSAGVYLLQVHDKPAKNFKTVVKLIKR